MHAQKLNTPIAVQKCGREPEYSFVEHSNTSQLIIQSPCIPYIPELGERVGVYAAVLLQQIHYWTQKGFAEKKHGKLWVQNKYEAWAQQLRCSLSCIRKTVKKLNQEGLIETKAFRSRYGDTTKWYAVNYEAVEKLGLKLNLGTGLSNNDASCSQETLIALSALNENHAPNQDNKTPTPQMLKVNSRVLHCDTPLSKISKVINNLTPANAESVYHHMVSIWNKTMRQGSKPIALTESRLRWLKRRFKIEFNNSIDQWRDYCSQIANNDFLMGTGKRGWKATLDWAIKPHNIQKVLTKRYQRWEVKKKDETKDSKSIAYKSKAEIQSEIQEANLMIKNSSHPVFWKEVCQQLLYYYGPAKFRSWITPLEVQSYEGQRVVLKAPTRFMRDVLERPDYACIILSRCEEADPQIRSLNFVYDPQPTSQAGITAHEKARTEIQTDVQEAERQIETSSHPEFWKEVCKHLLAQLGVAKFKGWISQIRLQNKYENVLVLKAASRQSLVWLKRNFSGSILECCQKLDPKISYLEFVCE